MISCMGGWCALRAKCPHHHAEQRHEPSERLCLPGEDGVRVVDASPFRTIRVEVLKGRGLAEDAA